MRPRSWLGWTAYGVVGVALIVVMLTQVIPLAGRVMLGEDPDPVLNSIRRQPAVTVAPPQLAYKDERKSAGNGTVVVTRYYEYSGSREPEAVLSYFRATLPSFGWNFDLSRPWRRAPNSEPEGRRDVYRKRVAGKQVTYVVEARPEGVSVEVFTFYDTGLIGG